MKNFFLKFFIVLTITTLTSFGFFINKNIHAQQLYCQQGYTLQGNLCVSNLPFLPSVAPTTTPPPSVLLNNSGSSEYSETGYTPLAQLPGLETLDFEADCPLADYINIVTEILIGIIVVICVVKLVLGGLEYITSESISGKANGKESIINGFAGLIIALSAYIVLNTINPTLLNLCPEIKNKSITAEDISGDSNAAPFSAMKKEDLEKLGVYCPGSGGTSQLSKIANSFANISNKVTYSQSKRGNISGSNLYLDCSSFVNQIYSCAGLSTPGGTTAAMFSSSNALSSSSASSPNFSKTLKTGDLLGWKAGESEYNGGHVVMYIGNGQFIEVAGREGKNPAVNIRNLNAYSESYKYLVKAP